MDTNKVQIFWDARVLDNDTGKAFGEVPPSPFLEVHEQHVENADRIRNMRAVLQNGPIAEHIEWRDGRLATRAELHTVHPAEYVDAVERFIQDGGGYLEANTVVSEDGWDALLAAAGTSIEAVDAVLNGETLRTYALVRPPGHHAQPSQAEGYGVFNHAALMAERALASGLKRVAIIDWDTHHGNGTQECFYDRSDVLFVSLHMRHGTWSETHPQTGSAAEIGLGDGMGKNMNVELSTGSGNAAYQKSWHTTIAPVLRQYQPELIIVSSGQDASAFDPNGRQNLSMRGFRNLGGFVREIADELCDGKVALVQEGGYHLSYAPYCLHATLEGLLNLPELLEDPIGYLPDDPSRADSDLNLIHTYHSEFWEF